MSIVDTVSKNLSKLKVELGKFFIKDDIIRRHTFIETQITNRASDIYNALSHIIGNTTIAKNANQKASHFIANKIPATYLEKFTTNVLPFLKSAFSYLLNGVINIIAWPLSLIPNKNITTPEEQTKTNNEFKRHNILVSTLGAISFAAVYDWFISLRGLVILGGAYSLLKLSYEKMVGTDTVENKVQPGPAHTHKKEKGEEVILDNIPGGTAILTLRSRVKKTGEPFVVPKAQVEENNAEALKNIAVDVEIEEKTVETGAEVEQLAEVKIAADAESISVENTQPSAEDTNKDLGNKSPKLKAQ